MTAPPKASAERRRPAPRRYNRRVNRSLAKLRRDQYALQGDLDVLRQDVDARQATQRTALVSLGVLTLAAAIALVASIVVIDDSRAHYVHWAVPSALYAVAAVVVLAVLVWL